MTAIQRRMVKIYITASDVNPSAVASSDAITGEIKSYARTGGEDDFDSEAVFGGYVDLEKPRSQVSIEMDIIPSIDAASATGADRWDSLIYGTTNSVYTYNSDAVYKAVFIEAINGSIKKAWAFNNCNAMSFDLDHNADGPQKGKFKFKFSPLTSAGISNFQTKSTAMTALPAWSTLTSA